MKRFIVCGGRNYSDFAQMNRCLSYLHSEIGIDAVIEGDANGADRMAGDWAVAHGIKVIIFPADWDKYGKTAGAIRNKKMLETKPDGVVAFPGGNGTHHMINIAKKAGVPVWEIQPDRRFFE